MKTQRRIISDNLDGILPDQGFIARGSGFPIAEMDFDRILTGFCNRPKSAPDFLLSF